MERRAYHKAEEWYRRCLEIVPREHPGLAFSSLVGIGMCASGRGQMREARRMADEAAELFEVRPFSHEVSHFYRLGAEIAFRDGRRGQAMEIIREGQGQFHNRRWPVWLRMQLWLCQVARRLRSASLKREAQLGIAEAQRLELVKRESDFRGLLSRATAA